VPHDLSLNLRNRLWPSNITPHTPALTFVDGVGTSVPGTLGVRYAVPGTPAARETRAGASSSGGVRPPGSRRANNQESG
jgi:hypothetical protein